jgi:hypothetical protein
MINTAARYLLTAAAAAVLATPAFSQGLGGNWRITFYLEPGHSLGSTQCLSFTRTGTIVGEPQSGTWFSPTFAGWRGQWIKEGDHFRFYGFTGTLATAEFGAMVSNDLFSGEFAHFFSPNGTTSSAGSYQAARVGACSSASVAPGAANGDPSGAGAH